MFPLPRLACELTDADKRIPRRRRSAARSHPRPPLPLGGPDGNAYPDRLLYRYPHIGLSGISDAAERVFLLWTSSPDPKVRDELSA